MEENLQRERDILLKIVKLYLKQGEPIGSRTLQRTYSLSFSPATIRNVMADLEDKGYLYQPHTSAGRVPTDKGLKNYINISTWRKRRNPRKQAHRLLQERKSVR